MIIVPVFQETLLQENRVCFLYSSCSPAKKQMYIIVVLFCFITLITSIFLIYDLPIE